MNRSTLLDQARRLAGTGALAIAPLALAPSLRAAIVTGPTFNPNATVNYGATNGFSNKASGNIAGTALPANNGVTGVKFSGDAIYNFTSSVSGGNISPVVNFNGTGGGNFSPNQVLPVRFLFDLNTSSPSDVVSSFVFTLSVGTSSGSFSTTFSNANVTGFTPFFGTQTFSYNSQIVLDGLSSGGGFQSYAGNLAVNFSNTLSGTTFTLHIPTNSVDFNPVPEPTTNALLLGAGALFSGIALVRRRRQQA